MVGTWWLDQVKRFWRSEYAAYAAVAGFSTLMFLWINDFRGWNIDLPTA